MTTTSDASEASLVSPKRRVSRRTIVGATAWTVPVIVASVATPALAASQVTPVKTFTGPADQTIFAGQTLNGLKFQAFENGVLSTFTGPISVSPTTQKGLSLPGTITMANGIATFTVTAAASLTVGDVVTFTWATGDATTPFVTFTVTVVAPPAPPRTFSGPSNQTIWPGQTLSGLTFKALDGGAPAPLNGPITVTPTTQNGMTIPSTISMSGGTATFTVTAASTAVVGQVATYTWATGDLKTPTVSFTVTVVATPPVKGGGGASTGSDSVGSWHFVDVSGLTQGGLPYNGNMTFTMPAGYFNIYARFSLTGSGSVSSGSNTSIVVPIVNGSGRVWLGYTQSGSTPSPGQYVWRDPAGNTVWSYVSYHS